MKIALIELNHMTRGIHTNTVPLGLGLIVCYLKKHVTCELDIRIFKDTYKCLRDLEMWQPDILGMAQYAWSSELNLWMARKIKKKNPACVVIAGGPNLDLEDREKESFLKRNPVVDLGVSYDGEIPFTAVVKEIIAGRTVQELRAKPVMGTHALHPETGALVFAEVRAPRLTSLADFGTMYADGFFDDFLAEGYHPFIQTQRGCPFHCLYCHAGDHYYDKVLFQPTEYFRKDMEYLGKRFSGNHNVALYLSNTNFSLFEQDFAIARVIREIQDTYDWPKNIFVDSGKEPDKLLKLVSLLRYKFTPTIALQTLTPKVLKNIHRMNIPFEKFIAFQNEVARTFGTNTATEIILSLPEETKESFLETIRRVLNSGVQNIMIYTLMSLRGTELASRDSAEKYGHVRRFRIVPRCFSEIEGEKIFDVEEVIVGTQSMPFEDYLELRGLALIVTAFASSLELAPLRRLLGTSGCDVANWIESIHTRIREIPALGAIAEDFLKETRAELFDSPESIRSFFNKPENYQALCDGKLGDNLLRKYKTLFLSTAYKEYLEIAFQEAARLIASNSKIGFSPKLLEDLKTYLESRDVGSVFEKGYDPGPSRKVRLHYDIPAWLADSSDASNIENFEGAVEYSIVVTDYMKTRLKDFMHLNRDASLSAQILYRDGTVSAFWPEWVKVQPKKSDAVTCS